jgi:hypothetical protein
MKTYYINKHIITYNDFFDTWQVTSPDKQHQEHFKTFEEAKAKCTDKLTRDEFLKKHPELDRPDVCLLLRNTENGELEFTTESNNQDGRCDCCAEKDRGKYIVERVITTEEFKA